MVPILSLSRKEVRAWLCLSPPPAGGLFTNHDCVEQGPSLKAIGIAALKGTKQIGKTLTAISDSPDRRGQGRLAKINARQSNARENRKSKKLRANTANPGYHDSLGLEHGKSRFVASMDHWNGPSNTLSYFRDR
jgi:hypothetical protein